MIVREVMVSELVTIRPSASITTAASTMLQKGTNLLFASDGHRLLGILTDSDILYGVVAQGYSTIDRQVWEFMDIDPPVAYPEMGLLGLLSLMDSCRLSRLPVVEEGKLIGTVILADIASKLGLA